MLTKKEVRSKVRTLKSEHSREWVEEESVLICERAFQLLEGRAPSVIALFLSMPDEVQTGHLIELLWAQGKHEVIIPRVEDKTTMCFYTHLHDKPLQVSNFGILEPIDDPSEERIPEIMIVPGMAFDLRGGRVGYGRGYYDRFFRKHEEKITDRIALCHEFQIFNEVPMDEHDRRMTQLITEDRIITF